MACQPSVLIVDGSQESREVLTTVLQRRGVRAFSASRAARGLQLARQLEPHLIVLDLETVPKGADQLLAPFFEESRRRETPLVLLGSARRIPGGWPAGEFIRKPYHYGPLIRKIEELLGAAQATLARCA